MSDKIMDDAKLEDTDETTVKDAIRTVHDVFARTDMSVGVMAVSSEDKNAAMLFIRLKHPDRVAWAVELLERAAVIHNLDFAATPDTIFWVAPGAMA